MNTLETHPEVASVTKTFAEYAAAPDSYSSIEGVPPEIAARLPGFADFGMDGEKLVGAVREVGPQMGPATPGWAVKLIAYGDASMRQGELAEVEHSHHDAEHLFLEASFWYFFARFPHILNPEGAVAYQKHTAAYLRAAKYFTFPVERITIPFEDSDIKAFLRFPKGERPEGGWPLVVIWGGIDVWKSDLEIHSQSNSILEQGIATVAVDMPGTGEAPIKVSPHAERLFTSVITAMRERTDIDAGHIGCYGLSFGGHWAVKMALTDLTLAAVVNNAGPVHHTFQPEWVKRLPIGAKLALGRVLGINAMEQPEALMGGLAALDLEAQNLLPTTHHAPLLSLNGEEDELVSIADLDILQEMGVKQDRLVFAHDRHVASRNWKLHERFVAAWLAKRLEG